MNRRRRPTPDHEPTPHRTARRSCQLAALALLALLTASRPAVADPGVRGGCCLGTGPSDCEIVNTEAECDALGGYYLGPNTNCSFVPCRDLGACCLADDSCVLADGAGECSALGGDYQGNSVECQRVSCVPPVGGCCIVGGPCTIETDADCQSLGGEWQGAGTDCSGCLGACCSLFDGSCTITSQAGCPTQFSLWLGYATDCTDCPGGACCLPGGTCAFSASQSNCLANGGTFYQGLTCGEVICGGACCFDGDCVITDQFSCLGSFHPGLSCDDLAACGGACCLPDGTCVQATENECTDDLGGTFTSGLDCANADCPITGGACCMTDGSCTFTDTGFECFVIGGIFAGGMDCATASCATAIGGCCIAGACSPETVTDCTSMGGLWQGPGTDCATITCPGGACCLPNGGCFYTTEEFLCFQQGGTPYAGVQCSDEPCEGACCFPDGSCTVTDLVSCNNSGGTYHGGLACDDLAACAGACCMPTGTCTQMPEFNCVALGGTFSAGVPCERVTCVETGGACCLGDDGCAYFTPAVCASFGGCFMGVGVVCPGFSCPEVLNTYATAPGLPIGVDGNDLVESVIVVAGGAPVLDVDVEISVDHTFVGDLCITLEHDGTSVDLVQRPGADVPGEPCHTGGPFGCPGNDYFGIVLDDAGTGGAIEDQCAAGLSSPPSFVPNEPLSAFRGLDAGGDWRLTVHDRANGDEGEFVEWVLRITTCGSMTCPADLTGPAGSPDGNVDALDFLLLIGQWGSPCTGPCDADFTGPTPFLPDGSVDSLDFLALIAQWGNPANCP